MNNSCCGWGYSYWNCNWHGGAVVYGSNGYYGNTAWHGGYYGSSAIRLWAVWRRAGRALAITLPPGPMPAVRPPQTPTARQAVGQAYNPNTGSLCRDASSVQRVWELRKLGCLQERQHRVHPASNHRERDCRIGADFGRWHSRCRVGASTATVAAWHKPQMATSMRRRTGMSTRTPGAVGTRPRGLLTTPRATQEPTLLLLAAMEGRKRAAESSAFGGGGGGWQSRQESARGSASRGGGGGWGGRR